MIRNYIKIAIRSLSAHKGYSAINIAGLSISLTVTLLMLLWVQDEWKTDRFHEQGDNIYRIKRTIPLEGQSLDVYSGIPYPVMLAAQEELPEVEKYIPLGRGFEESLQLNNVTFRASGTFGNAAYFETFSFPVLMGDVQQLDKKVDAIAISKNIAQRFFGHVWAEASLGETIHIHDIGDFIIEAVFEDFPHNSSVQNDFIYSFDAQLKSNDWMLEWTNSGSQGALVLASGANPEETAKKIEKMFQEHQRGDRKEGILLQKYADHYLFGQFDKKANAIGGRIGYVRTFGIAALLLLIISCINFVNLSTARASIRAKEVGVRKTVGAGKQSLMNQFMIEAGLITLLSIIIAFLLAMMVLPQVNMITDKALSFEINQPIIWIGIIAMFVTTTVLSGAYPAFVLSSYKPVDVLKGSKVKQSGNINFRKGLVVIQFVLAFLLIVSALVVQQQVHFVKNKNLGISKDNLMYIHQDAKVTAQYEVLRNELIAQDAIADVTVAGPSPIDMQASTSGVSWSGKRPDQENIEFQILWTASNFLEVFEVPLVSGRFYREGSIYDTTSIVFNERAIDIMGLSDPVGKVIQWWGKPRQIIGVIKDFHNRSLYDKIEPAGILLDPNDAGWLFVKAEPDQLPKAISQLESSFRKVLPDVPLHFDFVDAQYQRFYKNEELTGTLSNYFAVLSILISCLGLFGLATFFAEQKDKEIGIRKVLGASVMNLIGLLSKEFIILVVLGLMIGIPVAWIILNDWLGNFQYNVDLQLWMFLLPISLAIIIAGLSVGSQAIRAALQNPIRALRNE